MFFSFIQSSNLPVWSNYIILNLSLGLNNIIHPCLFRDMAPSKNGLALNVEGCKTTEKSECQVNYGMPHLPVLFCPDIFVQVKNRHNEIKNNYPLVVKCTFPKRERTRAISEIVTTLESSPDDTPIKMALKVICFFIFTYINVFLDEAAIR